MKYKSKLIIEALQLRWDTWSEMCDFICVGRLSDTNPEGCFGDKGQINLIIPAIMCADGTIKATSLYAQADENDYIIKDCLGYITILKPDVFEKMYEICENEPSTFTIGSLSSEK